MAIPLPQIFGNNQPLRITSGFGPRRAPTKGASTDHAGIDAAAPIGTPIKSLAAGKVIGKGHTAKSGNFITIDHGDGYVTSYSHLNKLPDLQKGSAVENGGYIGNVGRTGIATGPNVHVTLRKNGKAIDPTTIDDLESYIRPRSQETTTAQTVQPNQLLNTNSEVRNTKTVQNTQNTNNIMANPRNTQTSATGGYQKQGRGKVYATTGDMASDILGKGIGSVTAGEIMTMAMNQGLSRRDAQRAARGLEKFKSLGGNAEMVFDPNSNRYNVLFKDGQDVRVDTRQGRRLGANVKVGAADLIGLGRDVNYLAEVVSRSRAKAEEPVKAEQKSETNVEEAPATKSQSFTPFIKMAEPTLKYEMPTSERKFEEEIKSQYGVPDFLKPSDGDVNFFNPNVLDGTEDSSERQFTAEDDAFFRKAAYLPFKDGMAFKAPAYEAWVKGYKEAIKSNPYLTKEDYLKQEEASDIATTFNIGTTIASVLGAGPAIRMARGIPGRIAKYFTKTPAAANAAANTATKTATTVAPKAPLQLNEARITRMARERGASYNPSSGPVRPMPQTQPRTEPKELLRLSQGQRPPQAPLTPQTTTLKPVQTKPQVRRDIALDKYNKQKAAQERRNQAEVEYNIRRTKDASSRMAEEGGMHMKALGGRMSLPKYVDGNKIERLSELKGYDIKSTLESLRGKIPGLSLTKTPMVDEETINITGQVTGTGNPQTGDYEKGLNLNKSKFGLSDIQSIAKYAMPLTELMAARNFQKNVKKVPYTPIQARTGVVRDLPGRPSPIMRNVANRGSDVLTSGLIDMQTSALNRAAENAYNMQNQQSRIGQEQAIMDRENQVALMNARMKMAADQQNTQMANMARRGMSEAIRNVGLATQGNLAADAAQKNYLQGIRESGLLEMMVKYPDRFTEEQRKKVLGPMGFSKGGKLKFKISK